MTNQDFLNAMLEKHIKKAKEPEWKKNMKAIPLIMLYLLIFPTTTIYLFMTKHWILGFLMIIPTFFGLGISFGGRKFTMWLMKGFMEFKLRK